MSADQWLILIGVVFGGGGIVGVLTWSNNRKKLPVEIDSVAVASAERVMQQQGDQIDRLEKSVASLQAQINAERQAREREVSRAWERVMLGHTYAEELRAHINNRLEPPPPAYPEGWSAPWFAPTPSHPNLDQ